MDKHIGIIIFIVIAIISKILEFSQNKKQAKKKTTIPEQKPLAPVDYIAPKNEFDEFLQQIAIVQEDDEKITTPSLEKQQKQKVTKKTAVIENIERKQPDKSPELKMRKFVNVHKTDNSVTETITISSMLKNKSSVRNAFILSEIFQPPLSLRGNER